MWHRIWQRHSIPPHEIHALPWDDKILIYASEEIEMEEEEKEKARKKEEQRKQRGG